MILNLNLMKIALSFTNFAIRYYGGLRVHLLNYLQKFTLKLETTEPPCSLFLGRLSYFILCSCFPSEIYLHKMIYPLQVQIFNR